MLLLRLALILALEPVAVLAVLAVLALDHQKAQSG
jgi:hypothetical protein